MKTNKIYIDLNFNSEGSTGRLTRLIKNQIVHYRFNTNNPNGHINAQEGGYYLSISSPDTKIKATLFENGTAISEEYYDYSINIGMLLPYNQNYDFVVEADDKTNDAQVTAEISYLVDENEANVYSLRNSNAANTCCGDDCSESMKVFHYIPFSQEKTTQLSSGKRIGYTFTANAPNIHSNGEKRIYTIKATCENPIYMLAYPSDYSYSRAVTDAKESIEMSLDLYENTDIYIEIGISDCKSGTVTTMVTYESADIAPDITIDVGSLEYTPENTAKENIVADPVDAYTGAHTIKNNIMCLFGGQNVVFTAMYNSNCMTSGNLGYGWYHNYEKRIETVGDIVYVYESPSRYYEFISTEVNGLYSCNTPGKSGYELYKTNDGFIMNCNLDYRERYNADGQLVKIINKQGFETNITHGDSTITITDAATNKSIYLHKNSDGLIMSVSDDNDRTAAIEYLNGYLISICDVNNNTLSFTYDDYGRIMRGTDGNGTVYFTNVYNTAGKVVNQFDAFESIPTIFDYGSNTTTVINRNDHVSTRIYNDDGLLAEYIDENGNSKCFEYDDNYNVSKETDAHFNSIQKTYNSFNKPTEIIDKNGNKTLFEYDSYGNLKKITYPNNGIETFEYNERNQITTHTDLRGTVTTYTYDSNAMPASKKVGNKNAITYVYTNGLLMSETDAKGNVTSYEYNSLGQMICKTDALNNKTHYEYDLLGNVLKITDAANNSVFYTYDCNYQKVSQTDANGNITSYSYNGNLKPTVVSFPDNSCSRTDYDGEDRIIKTVDAVGNQTLYTYDNGGRLTCIKHPDNATELYTYDCVGNVIEETNPQGAVTLKTYDANSNVLSVTDTFGNVSSKQYDCMSRVTRVVSPMSGTTSYEYSLAGDLTCETDALGNKTIYTYDAYGNRTGITDPKGNTTTFAYDANNNMTSKTDALGNITTYEYDVCNRLIRVTNPKNQSVTYGYDVLGRRTSVTDAKGNTVYTTYDANGNVLTVKDAKNIVISTKVYNNRNLAISETDALGKQTAYQYTLLGNVECVTDPLNNTKSFSYNSRGMLISSTDYEGNSSLAVHDFLGNIISLIGPLGAMTTYDYDIMGRMISKSTVSGGTVEYQYNSLSLKSQIKNARNQTHSISYDLLGRIVGCTTPEDTISYTYDANGNILTVTDKNGVTTRTYDALNRVTSCTDTSNNTINYRYDSVGNLIALVYPDNTEVTYTYDANNNLTTVTDWSGRVTSYTYDVNNLLVGVAKPDGSVTTTVYDNAHRVVSSIERDSDDSIITGYEYTYDDLGRIVTEKDLAKNIQMCYTYDNLSRVIKNETTDLCCCTTTEETFDYDAAGNVNVNTVFEYDQNNKLISINEHPITYDMDGNMLQSYIDCADVLYTYDSSNRLTSAGNISYTYNAEDVRIRKTVGEHVTEYVYDINAKLSKLLVMTSNGVTTKYVYGLGLIGQECAGVYKTYHFDYRGSTTAITDITGVITDTFEYDTYGKLTDRTGTTNTPFLYNGRDGVITDENGLYYMRARYYCPEIKRFINADIVAGKISNAITLNRFAYADGNPVSNIDPFGLSAERGENALQKFFSSIDFDQDQFMTDFEEFTALDLSQEIFFNDDMLGALHASMISFIEKAKRPKGMGKREWQRLVDASIKQADELYGPASKLAKGLKAVPYVAVGIDTINGLFENIANGEDAQEIMSDATIDLGLGALSIGASTLASHIAVGIAMGFAGGSLAPGVGNVVGAIGGIVGGIGFYIFTEVIEINDTSIKDYLDNSF